MTDDKDGDKPSLVDSKNLLITHADNFLRRFSNKDDTKKRNKANGNEEIAECLSIMLDRQLLPAHLLQAIEHFGAVKVDAAVRVVVMKMKTSKITNLAAFLNKAIREDWSSEKTPVIEQKEPSRSLDSLSRNSNSEITKKSDHFRTVGDSNDIDSLKKENYWPLSWNKTFYRRLCRENRQPVVNEVANKWPYLHDHARISKIDLLSDDFIDDSLFKQFSQIINCIRLERAAHHLRSKIWNET